MEPIWFKKKFIFFFFAGVGMGEGDGGENRAVGQGAGGISRREKRLASH